MTNSGSGLRPPDRPTTIFPLIRHISRPLTILLLKTRLGSSQATFIALIFGIAAALSFLPGSYEFNVLGGLLLTINYILDNCDGEIARARKKASRFGHEFDTFVDWVVNSAVIAAMGHGLYNETQQQIWLWLGWAGAAGGTTNYFLTLFRKWRDSTGDQITDPDMPREDENQGQEKDGLGAVLIVAFREFARADFWFIVLVMALLDWIRYLLPLAAVGAQIYWILQFAVRGKDHRV